MEQRTTLHTGLFNTAAALICLCLTVFILVVGSSILIPLVAAVVVWYLMIRLAKMFSKLAYVGVKIPESLALFLSLLATGYIIYAFVNMVGNSINGIIQQAPQYQEKIRGLMSWIFQVSSGRLDLEKLVSNINLTSFFSNLAVTLTNVVSNLGVILAYVLFLLLEYKTFESKLAAMSKSKQNLLKTKDIIENIINDIDTYMKIKTIVSLLTAVASYITLIAYGISYAQFWALLIFILNFIPTIGSIIALAITLLAISIHFTSTVSFIAISVILVSIQVVVGNLIEPRYMARNLNLSPLIILLSLAFWGKIWGVLGMFICVPLMTIINIVLARFEQTRFLAVMFSADPDGVKKI